MHKYALRMIISGGQTGVDRAALDFALRSGIFCSGWCPKGRRSEDGVIPPHYRMVEAGSPLYQHRTRLNVRDADATLIFKSSARSRGTALTLKYCQSMPRPHLVICLAKSGDRSDPAAAETLVTWLHQTEPAVLNVAGPRASECSDAYQRVMAILALAVCPGASPPPWPPERPFTPDLPSECDKKLLK